MASRYSIFSLLKESFRGHRGWTPAWRDPEPKPAYDFIVVGGGGHGLATAYYLAKNHGARNVAVLEKGYIGGGNVGRNTTIIRSNYLMPGNIPFYEHSLKLWEGLEQDINYNAMISQRGVLNLFHNDSQRDACVRRGNAMHLHGVDGELLNREQVRKLLPMADFDNARFPIIGGLLQRRGGTVRHDAVAWGFARAADSLGVDIIQNCEVTGIRQDGNGVTGVETTRGFIASRRIGMACAGNTEPRRLARRPAAADRKPPAAGIRIGRPQADRAVRDHVRRRPFLHQPVRQGRPGVRRQHRHVQLVRAARQPALSSKKSARKAWRCSRASAACACCARGAASWTCRWTARRSSTARPVDGLYLNAGWCYGGFKATPASGWCFAHLLATDQPHEVAKAYRLDRFATGRLIDENGSGAHPNRH